MSNQNKCPKCNGSMEKANVLTPISIYSNPIDRSPYASYEKSYTPTSAYVCENCGYIEFYTSISNS